ncbi:MAG: hypothetical protein GY710_21630 [Desulfobacteraceae bacterium]|nr:hypothetical protein [Desulfobacteraceae bacterium]
MHAMTTITGISGSLRSSGYKFSSDDYSHSQLQISKFIKQNPKGLFANSEISLMAALMGSHQKGDVTTKIVNLRDYFKGSKPPKKINKLKNIINYSDGIIISTPVYFGDYSSLIRKFIELIRSDSKLLSTIKGKMVCILTCGAKRNGGQETALIYTLIDMLNLGFIGLGNGPDSTAQYGGTVIAGQKGTAFEDDLGMKICISTGRHIAKVAKLKRLNNIELKPVIHFWILQEKKRLASDLVMPILNRMNKKGAKTSIYPLYQEKIAACLACDICPTKTDGNKSHCKINLKTDYFFNKKQEMIKADIIIPTLVSSVKNKDVISVYKEFIERTRKIRRNNYQFTMKWIVPFILLEVGSQEHLDFRMITSLIRHNTMIYKPIILYLHKGKLLNLYEVHKEFHTMLTIYHTSFSGISKQKDQCLSDYYIPFGY